MSFYPFEVTIPHIIYTILGMFVVIFGMFSLLLREKLYIGEACWAFLFGIIIGPYGANIFDPRSWGNSDDDVTNTITLEFCRVVLAIGVFAIGVELPKAYMARHWKSIFFLLAPIMTWGWFVSAAFIYALIPNLNFLSSLAVAACLTPTDPILAAAVVGGKYADKHVPAHIRHLLAAESGCNDGAAFPFLYIALYLVLDNTTGSAIRDWFLLLWLYQVTLGIVIGSCLGFGFRHLMKFCERHNLIDRHSYIAQYISLALGTIGVTTLLGSDDLLSTFACGTAFAWDGFFNRQTEESVFSSVIDLLFNIAAFIFVGAWMPFNEFSNAETSLSVWRLIVIAILVLLFRRLPAVVALYKWIPDIKTFREAVFTGHFGPMGIGAVFISTLAAGVLSDNTAAQENAQTALLTQTIQPITAFMVLCSITIHGLSIPSFSLGRRVHSVSRTWSRHTSGLPEWATQARHVTDREDIVINRDRDTMDGLERGEHTPQEKLSPEGSVGSSPTEVEAVAETDKRTQHVTISPQLSPRASASPGVQGIGEEPGAEILPPGEEPPDGTETLSEWQEGPHRVIERRAGPGEEVEVEVIKNYGSPEAHSSLFRGERTEAHKHIKEYLGRLRKAVDDNTMETRKRAEKDVKEMESVAKDTLEHGAEKVEHSAHDAKEKAKEVVADVASIGHDSSGPSPGPSTPMNTHPTSENDFAVDDEEDEGWASDASGPVAPTDLSAVKKQRSKSPKSKSPKGSGRRRNSIRRGLMGRVMKTTDSGSKPSAVDEMDERGRTSQQVSSSPFLSSPRGSLRHHRIDSLRTLHSQRSREQSPARSIRFFDEAPSPTSTRPGSGTSTPRQESFHLRTVPGTPPDEADSRNGISG
ncbi:Sodium/hydrogen exchanger family-domain-containing protein [Lentinula raphanica]|uniref:Sodium/hydrogen exchanger family-domain-containing protein n=1 Tax=Lentinula raphanica TaxID=153919 RepID=A0AA38PD37_9AGAR|nr:Sodium/hydrogen exchanger family-domain-containing protein [Lentinula raphanica]KAJ3971432.1 Sodium/hydrogen exchanger family-domain-containing protein [Lentinula raphanica]